MLASLSCEDNNNNAKVQRNAPSSQMHQLNFAIDTFRLGRIL